MLQIKKETIKKTAVISLAALVPILVGVYAFYNLPMFQSYHSSKPAGAVNTTTAPTTTVPTVLPTMSNIPSSSMIPPTGTPITISKQQQTFTSTDLGISFQYLTPNGSDNVVTKVDGTKVYVYEENHFSSAQYVQVYTKSASDDITQAINKLIISSGSSTNDCVVISDNAKTDHIQPSQTSYQSAKVDYSSSNTITTGDSRPSHPNKCPDFVMEPSNYFLVDTNHPTKLLFFFGTSAYPLFATSSNLTWAQTISFL